jgi:hypothetical protein
MATDLTVANTILEQLGGGGRLKAMIGAYNFVGSENDLSFRFKCRAKNGSNCVRVILTPMDVYRVEFLSVRAGKVRLKEVREDIYCDVLREVIERATGLYLSLGTMTG